MCAPLRRREPRTYAMVAHCARDGGARPPQLARVPSRGANGALMPSASGPCRAPRRPTRQLARQRRETILGGKHFHVHSRVASIWSHARRALAIAAVLCCPTAATEMGLLVHVPRVAWTLFRGTVLRPNPLAGLPGRPHVYTARCNPFLDVDQFAHMNNAAVRSRAQKNLPLCIPHRRLIVLCSSPT